MKITISYFYNIRFFKPNQIPVSTAIWDPKWFHQNKGNSEVFIDRNGVINGLRIEELNPVSCHADGCPCEYHKTGEGFQTCKFLQLYRQGLNKLNFEEIISKLQNIAIGWKNLNSFEEDSEIVLIVYETPDNPCSERVPLIEWFASNGINLKEWTNALPN